MCLVPGLIVFGTTARKRIILRASNSLESDLFWLSVTTNGYTRGVAQRTAAINQLVRASSSSLPDGATADMIGAVGFSGALLRRRRQEIVEALERSVDEVVPAVRKLKQRRAKAAQAAAKDSY